MVAKAELAFGLVSLFLTTKLAMIFPSDRQC
jgi:hypothetical protein